TKLPKNQRNKDRSSSALWFFAIWCLEFYHARPRTLRRISAPNCRLLRVVLSAAGADERRGGVFAVAPAAAACLFSAARRPCAGDERVRVADRGLGILAHRSAGLQRRSARGDIYYCAGGSS